MTHTHPYLPAFLASYLTTLRWADCGPDSGIPACAPLSPSLVAASRADAVAFLDKAAHHIDAVEDRLPGFWLTLAAHDFWLTRRGHGAGFWDGDWPSPEAEALYDLAKSFGDAEVYLGDDGLVYLCGREPTHWLPEPEAPATTTTTTEDTQ